MNKVPEEKPKAENMTGAQKSHYEKIFRFTVQIVAAFFLFGLIGLDAVGILINSPPLMVYGLLVGIIFGVGKIQDYIKLTGKKE